MKEREIGGVGRERDRYEFMFLKVMVKKPKQTIWREGSRDDRFGAEKRFTVSLRCQISIGSLYTNTKAASSVFSLCQDSPSAPGMDSHARSKLWGTSFVIDDQDSGLLPNINGPNFRDLVW